MIQPGTSGGSPGAGGSAIPGRPGGIPGQPPTFSNGTAPGTPPGTPPGVGQPNSTYKPPSAIGGLQSGISATQSTAQGPGAPTQPSTYPSSSTGAPSTTPPPPQNQETPPNLATAMMGSAPQSQATQQNPVTGATAPSTSQQFAPVSPGSNLIGSQINLQQSPNTQQSGQQLSNLASNLSNPDVYQQAALGSFNTFAQQTDPAYQAAMRQATAQAAANGGIGSGALSTTYGNLANQRNLQLEGMQQTAQQQALTGQAQYQLQQLGALQGVNSQQFGQDVTNTNQLNNQQQYQNALQQQAINNAVTQTGLEGQLQNQNFNQQLALGEFGYSGNPAQQSSQLANQYGQVGNQTANQLGQIAQQQGVNSALNQLTGAGASGLQSYINSGNSTVPQVSSAQAGQSLIDPYTMAGIGSNGAPLPNLTSPSIPSIDPSSMYGAGYTVDPTTGQLVPSGGTF